MLRCRATFVLMLLSLTTTTNSAWAFDCNKAITKTEKAICNSPELKTLDEELNKSYKDAIKSQSDANKLAELKSAQRKWIQTSQKNCNAELSCLKKGYSERIAGLKAMQGQSPAPAMAKGPAVPGINYRVIESQARKPLQIKFERVEFFGSNTNAVANLNKAVKELWHDEIGCSPESKEGEGNRSLEVAFLNEKVAVFQNHVDIFCEGSPYREARKYFVDVSTGKIIDFWTRLDAAGKEKILTAMSRVQTASQAECKNNYSLAELRKDTITVEIEKGMVSLLPSFANNGSGCDEGLDLPIKDFQNYFKNDPSAQTILEALNPNPAGGISYRVIEKKESKPLERDVSWIEFVGANQAATSNLNNAVQEILKDEKKCSPTAKINKVKRHILVKVLKEKSAVLHDSLVIICSDWVSPEYHDIEYIVDAVTGERIDLWKRLKPESKEKLFSTLADKAMAKLATTTNEWKGLDCKGQWAANNLKKEHAIVVSFEKAEIWFQSFFGEKMRGCAEVIAIPIKEMETNFKDDPKVVALLETLLR